MIASALWDDLRSGYDVRLIADLAKAEQALPGNRLQLYQATLDYAVSLSVSSYRPELICGLAWRLWTSGRRVFQTDDQVTSVVLEPMLRANMVVRRGEQFEFRHDLMRGFLAASWATRYASSLGVTQSRLELAEIWDLPSSEQDLCFPFLAALVASQSDLQALAEFAAQDVDKRSRLLAAIKHAAKKKKWPVRLQLG